jgi:hypothetical protein
LIRPRIQLKPIEGDATLADGNFGEVRAHLSVEAVSIHCEIRAGFTRTDPARCSGLDLDGRHIEVADVTLGVGARHASDAPYARTNVERISSL